MTNISNISDHLGRSRTRIDSLRAETHLTSGPGGPSDGDMKARVARLEDKVDRLDDRVRGGENQLATLIERVSHLPTKGFIVSALLIGLAVIAGFIGFTDNIQALFGQTP